MGFGVDRSPAQVRGSGGYHQNGRLLLDRVEQDLASGRGEPALVADLEVPQPGRADLIYSRAATSVIVSPDSDKSATACDDCEHPRIAAAGV